ncbi:MAG: glycosyltransferase [Phycisphaerales bacterium]
MQEALGIIIPVYNEGGNISNTLTAIQRQVHTDHVIYIIYDFDEDNTLPVVQKLKQERIRIELLKNTVCGVASAIKTGLRKAEHEYLLVTMADMSDDYSVVDKMCEMMHGGSDLVCGSRYMKGGRQIGGPAFKKFLSRTAGVSLKYLAGTPVHDITNSFKLYRKSMLDKIKIESENGFEIGMEIAVKAHFSGYKVGEIPCTWTDRTDGQSRFRLFKWMPKYLRWYFFALKKKLHIPVK